MVRHTSLFVLLLLVVACGGGRGSEPSSSLEGSVDECLSDSLARAAYIKECDSLIAAMQVRYEELCHERRCAYSLTDSAERAVSLERNDAACRQLSDSLQRVVQILDRLN